MIKHLSTIGGVLFVLGLAGMSEAVTGQGSFMVSTICFAVGIGMCLAGYLRIGQ